MNVAADRDPMAAQLEVVGKLTVKLSVCYGRLTAVETGTRLGVRSATAALRRRNEQVVHPARPDGFGTSEAFGHRPGTLAATSSRACYLTFSGWGKTL